MQKQIMKLRGGQLQDGIVRMLVMRIQRFLDQATVGLVFLQICQLHCLVNKLN